MELLTKYKSYIIGAVYGAVAIIFLNYLVKIPAWLVGALIGASVVPAAAFLSKYFDEAVEKGQGAVKKTTKSTKDAVDEISDVVDGK